jgi:hypothetical protein
MKRNFSPNYNVRLSKKKTINVAQNTNVHEINFNLAYYLKVINT